MDDPPPKVAVVILNWNKADLTRNCLAKAKAATTTHALWIVVDNGSTEPISGLDADVELIRNAENKGFAGGVNCGLRRAIAAGADYIWLLNNDTEPLPHALDRLVNAMLSDPLLGLASAVILNADAEDAVEFHGGIWENGDYRGTQDPKEYAGWTVTAPDRIWLLGTALLVNRRLIEKIGYLDEVLFAYWEDNDLSRRSAMAGFRNVVVSDARVRHASGAPAAHPEERPPYYYYYMARNELLVMRKTLGALRLKPLYWLLRRNIRTSRRLRNLPSQRQAFRQGVRDGLLARGGPYGGQRS